MEQKSCSGRRLYAARKRAVERELGRRAVAGGLGHRREGSVSAVTSRTASLSAPATMLGGGIWQRMISLVMRNGHD